MAIGKIKMNKINPKPKPGIGRPTPNPMPGKGKNAYQVGKRKPNPDMKTGRPVPPRKVK